MKLVALLIALVVVMSGLVPAAAQAPEGEGPRELVRPERMVHHFHFNERELGNFEDMPMHWYAIGRPPQTTVPNFLEQPLHRELTQRAGFPRFTQVGFDDSHAVSGQMSFRLGVDGGHVGAFLEVGTLPAVPSSDYRITAYVRTEALERAGAQMAAYFVDNGGRRIEASVRRTQRIRTQGRWTQVAVTLRGDHEEAAWIGLEVKLLQPQHVPGHPLGQQQLVLQDVRGWAWFDEIRVWQIPRVELSTQQSTNVMRGEDRPTARVEVRDLTGRRLAGRLAVYDHAGREVDRLVRDFGRGQSQRVEWQPDLPGYGWYQMTLHVRDVEEDGQASPPDQAVAQTRGALLWLPDHRELPREHAGRFTVLAEGLDGQMLGLAPELTRQAGIQRVVLSAWTDRTTTGRMEERLSQLESIIERLRSQRTAAVLSFSPVPESLLAAVEPAEDHPLAVFAEDEGHWMPYVAPMLMRHGHRESAWHLGHPAEASAFFMPRRQASLERINRLLRDLAPRPRPILPWSVHQSPPEGLDRSFGFAVDVPPGTVAERTFEALRPWEGLADRTWVLLREPGADEQAHRRRAANLAIRMVQAWRMEPEGLLLDRPFARGAREEVDLVPDPLLGVFANVGRYLLGRRHVGRLPLEPGLEGLIFDGPAGGMLVLWNRHAPAERARLELDLGGEPVVGDVWGNRRPLSREQGRHHLEIGAKPLFVTGIDAELALFRGRFVLEPELVRSTQRPQEHTLRIGNPWAQTISGWVRITGPEDWQIEPRRRHFSIPSGGQIEIPLTLRFPILEVAGMKELTAELDFTADQHHRVAMQAPMELGLPEVDFDATLALEGNNAHATVMVMNTGNEPITFAAFANLRGHARQETILPTLEPGETVVRRFEFINARETLENHPVRAGVRQTDGPAILNERLELGR